ncbi:MurR/RpiR family transcriptional regulator [Kribbella sp. NPDC051770]|uniref:MurR/RpiR family transcriptional regulator n=1 Tax=Kribbella sp. NPDC051770 TaxID=3155413 RepID=UPI00341671CF
MSDPSAVGAGPDIADRVRATLPRLTGALRLVADFVLAEPAVAAELSTAALAERAGVSQASVTRFAQAVGLSSHQQLRIALAAQLGRAEVPGWSTDLGPLINDDDTVARVATVVANADIRAITQTVDQLDLEALDRAAHVLAAARRIDVYGVGGSSTIAAELEMRLFRIGCQVRAWPEIHGAATSAALLTASDAVVAISHSGATTEVMEPVELAQDRGAQVIAITSDPRSPLAAAADEVLATAVLETTFRSGGLAARHSQLVVTDCLYIRVAQLTSYRAANSIDLTKSISPHHTRRRR